MDSGVTELMLRVFNQETVETAGVSTYHHSISPYVGL